MSDDGYMTDCANPDPHHVASECVPILHPEDDPPPAPPRRDAK